ncbi:hypothetical protein GCM10022236_41290 [Microlunatus ginsengisoli]|uniref:Uncharacterized protein n=1 Tax=Microlunatus ginsengisoli TaxID=363863 RepID=A0ABP7AL09_9ACTN
MSVAACVRAGDLTIWIRSGARLSSSLAAFVLPTPPFSRADLGSRQTARQTARKSVLHNADMQPISVSTASRPATMFVAAWSGVIPPVGEL